LSWDRNAQLAAIATLDRGAAAVLHDWFSCTQLLVGDGLAAGIERFRRRAPRDGEIAADQAARWRECLAAVIADDPTVEGYAADVATYEGTVADLALGPGAAEDARLAAARNARRGVPDPSGTDRFVPVIGRHVRVTRFSFEAPSIVAAVEACDRLGEHERPAPCTALFVRQAHRARPHVMYVSKGVELLLGLCDGRHDGAAIIDELARRAPGADRGDLAARTCAALAALRARNVVSEGGAEP
jgi:hypothetical protein